MQFPVTMNFKLLALTPQVTITDANGQVVCFVKQKMFKLKEQITVFSDEGQQQPIFGINADKVLDFSARYRFTDSSGQEFGAVKRQGRKSIWKARYDVYRGEQVVATIQEKNPWVKVGDALFSEIPVVGLLTGYVFNPSYEVVGSDGQVLVSITKKPSFTSRTFVIEQVGQLDESMSVSTILSTLMMVLRERRRG